MYHCLTNTSPISITLSLIFSVRIFLVFFCHHPYAIYEDALVMLVVVATVAVIAL